MEKLISVIIPIYNCEKTINATIESIIGQSYKHLEVIIIDDGSVDNSYNICEEYMRNDNRIKIIKQKNSGVGEARNKGIYNSTGYYVSFIDGDDTIDKNFYEELVKCGNEAQADIIASNVCVIIGNDYLYPYGNSNQNSIYIGNQIKEKYLNFEISTAVWGKLYLRSLIGNLRFEKLNINEDFIFNWEIIKKSKKYFQNYNTHYNYNTNTLNSLTKIKFSNNNMSMVNHATSVMRDVMSMNDGLLEAGKNYYYGCVLHNFVLYYEYLKDLPEELYINEKNVMIDILKRCTKLKKGLLVQETDINISDLINQVNQIIYDIENGKRRSGLGK